MPLQLLRASWILCQLLQYMTIVITHRHASPQEANATGEQTGPFPTSERASASKDAANPRLEDASAKAYFPAPSGRLFAWIATSNTERPIAETRISLQMLGCYATQEEQSEALKSATAPKPKSNRELVGRIRLAR